MVDRRPPQQPQRPYHHHPMRASDLSLQLNDDPPPQQPQRPYHHHPMRASDLPLQLNDGRPPQLPQSVNNIYTPTTMSTQQPSSLTDPLFRAIYDDLKRLP